nr:MAG TPA: helix-turn-helix domain protein [Caudoviricetes sp.]
MTFGDKIKSARISKKLTQKQLADLIGAKHNSVSDWEKDKSRPDMDTIELICGTLDINPSYLMGTKSDDEYGNIVGSLMNNPDLLDMIEEFKNLSENDKKAIRQLISSLSKLSRG